MMFDGTFERATILRTGPDGLTRVIVRSSWAERESILGEACEAELLVLERWSEFHKGARLPAELSALLLKLRDEAFLLRVPAQYLQSCRPLRQQRLIGHHEAGFRHEDSSAVNVQEYPKRGHSLNHALNRDEIVVVSGHHATSVEKGSGSEIRSTDGMASERLSRWGGPVKRFRSCLYSLLVGLQGR
jgi:hypothetical protein